MRVGITVGVFDVFHLGHLRMLQRARNLCDYLIVGVHDDINNSKGVKFAYSLSERLDIVSSLKPVGKACRYTRVDIFLEQENFDVFFYGPDQSHAYFQRAFEYCKENNKISVLLDRTPGISSTMLRSVLNEKNV